MRIFRRRPRPERGSPAEGASFAHVAVGGEPARATVETERRALVRVAAESVIRHDEAEAVLAGIRRREALGRLAPRGGPLVHRFFCLRDELPAAPCLDPELERLRATLDSVLHHHAILLSTAMEMLAYEWRSERLSQQIDTLDGMGAPGRWLEAVYVELTTGSDDIVVGAPQTDPA